MALIEREPIEKYISDRLTSGEIGHDGVEILGELYVAPEVDPVHAAGGAYCRECELRKDNIYGSYCGRYTQEARSVAPDGFCSYGRRREGGE